MAIDPGMGIRRLQKAAGGLAFGAICLLPYLARLRSPSLYADDVDRIAQLQSGTLRGLLWLPFNEHLAPLFQSVTWLTWQAAGRSVAAMPLALTLASFLPYVLTLGLLYLVIRGETRSEFAGLACVAAFSLSWLAIETVYWYSASSFMWALLGTLAAWQAARGGSRRGAILGAFASAAAPAFSAIGLLAGPSAAIRLATGDGRRRWAGVPLLGTLAFLGLCALYHDRAVLASNVEEKSGIGAGLLAASRAPLASLLPALAGLRTLPATGLSGMLETILGLVLVAGSLAWARRSREDRGLILGGLLLIAGGYALTFCARAGEPGRALLETQRYHLFPMLGLMFLLAVGLRRVPRSIGEGSCGVGLALALAGVLWLTHRGEMQGRARFMRFPDQAATLAAIDRLASFGARAGISREQAMAALDPVEASWAPAGRNLLVMLPPCPSRTTGVDPNLRANLLAALSLDDRRALCGGMDATAYLRPANLDEIGKPGKVVNLFRVSDEGGTLVSQGWPSYAEFAMNGEPGKTGLILEGKEAAGVEVWWRGEGERWSSSRSVRLLLRNEPNPGVGWVLPVERLPHGEGAMLSRVRLLFHDAGPVGLGSPRVLR